MEGVRSIVTGGSHNLALTENGNLWAWGENLLGRIGNGNTENQSRPLLVLDQVVLMDANNHSLAMKADGSLWAWGQVHLPGAGNAANTVLSPALVWEGN